jgi:hypothetical protein
MGRTNSTQEGIENLSRLPEVPFTWETCYCTVCVLLYEQSTGQGMRRRGAQEWPPKSPQIGPFGVGSYDKLRKLGQ